MPDQIIGRFSRDTDVLTSGDQHFSNLHDGTFTFGTVLDDLDASGNIRLPSGYAFLRAAFERAGPDLLVETPSGGAFVVPDYFFSQSSPALITHDGGVLSAKLVTALAGTSTTGMVAQLTIGDTSAQGDLSLGAPIGQVSETEGAVSATHPDGSQENLATGSSIYQGDVVQTGAGASVGIVFADDTVFTLDEDGRMVMDEMVYDPDTQTGSFKTEVVQGCSRSSAVRWPRPHPTAWWFRRRRRPSAYAAPRCWAKLRRPVRKTPSP